MAVAASTGSAPDDIETRGINTVRGLTDVSPAAFELMSSYASTDAQTMRKLRVPNALPYWFTALRIATTLSVIGAVVGEFFGGPLYALGIYITLETGHSRYPTAWAAIVLACALGIVLYLADVLIERRARWDLSYYVFNDDSIDAVAPIVARLAGT